MLVYIFHLISLKYAIGNGLKVLAFVGFLVNLASSFNINIPYITDKKKLPKNYNAWAFIITIIVVLIILVLSEIN